MTGVVAVIGAINVDLVVRGAPLPRPGQTVVGGAFSRHHGGKGGNQAVAAARAGASVVMFGAVGRDRLGDDAIAALAADGADVSRVRRVDAPTGVALIAVDAGGENQIAVAAGANDEIGDLTGDLGDVAPTIVLLSCELPYATLSGAARWCREHEVTLVVNPAPAAQKLRSLLDGAAVATPNRDELDEITPGVTGTEPQARELAERYAGLAVVVSLGPEGALVATSDGVTMVPAPEVEVFDTTGAGDCLNGVLAAGLAEGLPLGGAVARAVMAAALSVRRHGARDGMPTRAEIDAAMGGSDQAPASI